MIFNVVEILFAQICTVISVLLCSKVTKSKVKTIDTNAILTGTKNLNISCLFFCSISILLQQKAEAIHKIRVEDKYPSVKPNIKHKGLVSQTGLRLNQD